MFRVNSPGEQLGALTSFAPEVVAKLCWPPRIEKSKSISPARIARARLVSSEKNLNEIRWIGTAPPHQCGLADSSAPVVGSKLSTSHGPDPITRTPGLP